MSRALLDDDLDFATELLVSLFNLKRIVAALPEGLHRGQMRKLGLTSK